MEERISKIIEYWSIREPGLLSVYYTHKLEENNNMSCCFRIGRGLIEFNSSLLEGKKENELDEMLMTVALRICLRHPYERQPYGCPPNCLIAASDMVLSPVYRTRHISLFHPADFQLPVGKSFEWYASKLMEMASDADMEMKGINSEINSQYSSAMQQLMEMSQDEAAMWQEDEEMRETIKERVESISSWGTVPTDIQELIKIAMEGRIDYRKVLRAFSTSIVSSERKFTRMRPNRRLGFKAMGSKHEMASRLLVAVDVSGSITNKSIGSFFRIITRFFKYGVEEVDVIQFDSEVKDQVLSLDKAAKNYTSFTRLGDGGTSFQSVMDYQNKHKGYDGVIIFTDGYAPVPDTYRLSRSKLLWVFDTEENYNENKDDLSPIGRTCFIM